MAVNLYLPDGFYTFAILYSGSSVPRGAVNSGCGVNQAAATPTLIAANLILAWQTYVMPLLTDTVTMEGVYVRQGQTIGIGPSVTTPADVDGSSASATTSPNVTYLARLGTPLGGPRGRGRWFLPGVGEDKVAGNGIVVGSFVTTANAALANVLSSMAAVDLPLAVGHRYEEPFPIGALSPSQVTSASLDDLVATQRRRLR